MRNAGFIQVKTWRPLILSPRTVIAGPGPGVEDQWLQSSGSVSARFVSVRSGRLSRPQNRLVPSSVAMVAFSITPSVRGGTTLPV